MSKGTRSQLEHSATALAKAGVLTVTAPFGADLNPFVLGALHSVECRFHRRIRCSRSSPAPKSIHDLAIPITNLAAENRHDDFGVHDLVIRYGQQIL